MHFLGTNNGGKIAPTAPLTSPKKENNIVIPALFFGLNQLVLTLFSGLITKVAPNPIINYPIITK